MTRMFRCFRRDLVVRIAVAVSLPVAFAACGESTLAMGVRIDVGVDPRVVVGAYPAGTVFVFAAGVHRLVGPIVPRVGDVFVGEPGAVLSGARLLSSFEREGGLWVVAGQTQQGRRIGECEPDSPRCAFPEDLFIDDVPLRHVASLADVVPGAWFFDYENDRIVFADDPSGRRVETSVARAAFASAADAVTIRDLVIEKFANPARPGGAIQAVVTGAPSSYGERWIIENNIVRLNHGAGITAGHGAQIRGNRVLWNGQMGLGGGWGHGTLVEGNEIAYNNWAGFYQHWEAGGAKWAVSDGLVVRGNHAHHNRGNGLWTDINNINTLYEYNVSEYNARNGIFHEVSYRATIRYNTLQYNGIERGHEEHRYVDGAGVLVAHSPDVTVYGNVVKGNWNGIIGLQGNRGSGTYGAYEVRNLSVYDNDIEVRYWPDGYSLRGRPEGVHGRSGVFRNGGFDGVWDEEANNRFDRNRYTILTDTTRHWFWANADRDFAAWQAFGQDQQSILAGSLTNGTDAHYKLDQSQTRR